MNTNIANTGHPIHYKFWTIKDLALLGKCTTMEGLADITIGIMDRMPTGIHMVSGPISSGKGASTQERLRIFSRAVEKLSSRDGITVLSQIPFEQNMMDFTIHWKRTTRADGYCWPILHIFYERVFSSRKVAGLHFLHSYESSTGARWEHQHAPRWGIKRYFFGEAFTDKIIRELAQESDLVQT